MRLEERARAARPPAPSGRDVTHRTALVAAEVHGHGSQRDPWCGHESSPTPGQHRPAGVATAVHAALVLRAWGVSRGDRSTEETRTGTRAGDPDIDPHQVRRESGYKTKGGLDNPPAALAFHWL